ncbi:hypothetical protein D3C71_1387120 [compost metagenome]
MRTGIGRQGVAALLADGAAGIDAIAHAVVLPLHRCADALLTQRQAQVEVHQIALVAVAGTHVTLERQRQAGSTEALAPAENAATRQVAARALGFADIHAEAAQRGSVPAQPCADLLLDAVFAKIRVPLRTVHRPAGVVQHFAVAVRATQQRQVRRHARQNLRRDRYDVLSPAASRMGILRESALCAGLDVAGQSQVRAGPERAIVLRQQ